MVVGGGVGRDERNRARKRKKSLPPTPLSRGDVNTHTQARVGLFEMKMAARKPLDPNDLME